LESEEWCDLVPEEDVKFINPYKFGDAPYSDNCNEFEVDENYNFECIYDEVISDD
jgi:hypothetical protein